MSDLGPLCGSRADRKPIRIGQRRSPKFVTVRPGKDIASRTSRRFIVAIDQNAEAALGNRGVFPKQAIQHWWPQQFHSLTGQRSSQILPETFEERVPYFAFSRFRPVIDFSQKLRFYPDAAVRDLLGLGLRLSDERRQSLAQIRSRRLIKPVIDLAGVNKVFAFVPAYIDAVPFVAIECKSGIASVSRCAQAFFTQVLPRPEA
jgi:hypothetical protein